MGLLADVRKEYPDAHPLVVELRAALLSEDDAVYIDRADAVIAKIDRALQKPQLWGVTEVAEFMGVQVPNVYKLYGLPAPALQLQRGWLWNAWEIREFAKRRKRNA